MAKENLIINGVDIPLDKGIGTILTYSITDIEQPDKRKASFSKTIKIPSSKVIEQLFNYIFEVNIDSTFNPNLKASAIYLIDDVSVFTGIIQLKKINKLDNSHYIYEVVLLGELANIFINLGEAYIDDLDMNWVEFDHEYSPTNIQNSWDTSYFLNGVATGFQYGAGYTYPMINYSQDANTDEWDMTSFFPAVYVKEYIDRMFLAAGFEYDSTFFNTSYFRKLIIPFSGKEFTRSTSNMSNANVVTSSPIFDTTGTTTSTSLDTFELIRFTTEVQDVDTQHNPANGTTTIAVGNENAWSCNHYLDFQVDLDSGLAATSDMISTYNLDLVMLVNGVPVDQVKGWIRPDPAVVIPITGTPYSPSLDQEFLNQAVDLADLPDSQYTAVSASFGKYRIRLTSTQPLYAADVVTFKLKTKFIPDTGETNNFRDGSLNEAIGSASITINAFGSSSYVNQPTSNTYWGGNVLEMRHSIPKQIKKKDFFKSIIQMFNLYIEPSADNPNILKIEPRNDFYTSDVNDWSSKLDISKDIKYDMLAAINKSKYIYDYKEDKDYYNEKHTSSWSRGYGDRHLDIINDFSKGEYKQTVIFSATPSVGDVFHNRIIPTILGVDKDEQPIKVNSNIRILQYMGLKASNVQWQMNEFVGNTNSYAVSYHNDYPYAGMWNDAYNPTEDLGFGLPKEIYWDNTFGTITVSNNNLYNKYHKSELEELTNKDSKMVTAWFLLDPIDINNLDFKALYFFDNAYYRLQEVKYNPTEYNISECKFLKLKTGSPFVSVTTPLVGGFTDELAPFEFSPSVNSNETSGNNILNTKSVNVSGTGNIVNKSSTKIDIVGDDNKVFSGSNNIAISGSGNTIGSNLKNVTLTNTDNTTITESDTTYVDGVYQNTAAAPATNEIRQLLDGPHTQDFVVTGYECDCTLGKVTISLLDGTSQGYEQTFKKLSGAYDVVLTNKLMSGLIEGDTEIKLTTINDAVTLYWNGTDYNIK